ncbi:MAG: alpha/beta fold hydrolase [Anaerolineae bacterium]|nr:alpha/beta fold hydrolase [Anaerolineae bacterium]
MTKPEIFSQLNPFQGNEHQPFYWDGGQPAALLVHGFPGTPVEMRPLAMALHRAGWSVCGPLLPGFGPQVATIFERDYTEWVAVVETKLAELQQKHRPVLLVGHSMGGAVSIQAAARRSPDALALTAPFWQLGEWWQRWICLLVKPFFRQIRPFKNADFSNPELRRNVHNFLPDIDFDNPETRQGLRDLAIPVRILEQLLRVGRRAYRVAPQVNAPTLVIQGNRDETVPANRTRRLLRRLPGLVRFEEINTGHYLIRPEDPGWPAVEQAVLAFAGFVEASFAQSAERSHHANPPLLEKIV